MRRWSAAFLTPRRCLSSLSGSYRVCIVGSGPSGFYTAKYLLKENEDLHIDIIDRLPTPYGLVRSGVAPDHQNTKSVMSDFSNTLDNPKVRFHGNVEVGTDISVSELRTHYDALVLAYGAEGDRALGIPGEDLIGVRSARELVNWYNGHPDYVSVGFEDLLQTTSETVVIGQGNVAIDVSRVLLTSLDILRNSDICDHALTALEKSTIQKVSVIGRRGPIQASFTIKELRELTSLVGTHCSISKEEIEKGKNHASLQEAKARPTKRKFDLMEKIANKPNSNAGGRELIIRFFLEPLEIVGDSNGRAKEVICAITSLSGEPGLQRACDTGERISLPAQLVLTSVGYKSKGMEGIPFDDKRNVIPSLHGRVIKGVGSLDIVPGVYVSGWLKRGPSGIIGTNIPDAKETAKSIREDLSEIKDHSQRSELRFETMLDKDIVNTEGWRRIETVEDNKGKAKGKPREKIVSWEELLETARTS